jgi:hypothetical protein
MQTCPIDGGVSRRGAPIRRKCEEPGEIEVGLPTTKGGTLWLGRPWCRGHATFLARASAGIRFRSTDGTLSVL